MKTIRRFFNDAEAGFAQSLLVSAGIGAVLAEGSAANTIGPLMRGVRLQVPEEDEARALDILDKQEGFAPLPDDFVPEEVAPGGGDATLPPKVERFGNLRGLIPAGLCVVGAMAVVYVSYRLFAPLSWRYSAVELVGSGNAALGRKDFAGALNYYDAALAAKPQDRVARYDRGVAFLGEKDYGRAVADFTEAITLDPRNAQSYTMRGLAYVQLDRQDLALDDFTKAIEFDPRDTLAYSNRALLFLGVREYDRAFDDFQEVTRRDPGNAVSHWYLGNLYLKRGEYDDALEEINRAIELVPKSAMYFSGRAVAYSRNGDAWRAMEDLDRAIRLAPEQWMAYNNLAWLYATYPKTGARDGVKAMALARKACELTNWRDSSCVGTLAAAEAEAGRFDDAIMHQRLALEMARANGVVDKKVLGVMTDALAGYQRKMPYRDVLK